MTNVQSKLSPIYCTCKQLSHPWTDKCINATAGLMMHSIPHSVRIYTVVYALSMLMRTRLPTFLDFKRTLLGIIQSSAFLGTNSFSFAMYVCILRNLLGCFHFPTLTFLPAYLASLTAIYIERPVRRPLLALYVANVATETIWKMCEQRGLVHSIPYGETMIFGVSVSLLLYLYRLGKHKEECKDSLFRILQIFVGRTEEGPVKKASFMEDDETLIVEPSRRRSYNFSTISGILQAYSAFIETLKRKHHSCPHKRSCISYSVIGGIKPFIGGLALQFTLKFLLNIKKVIQFRMDWRKIFLDGSFLRLGTFLGAFSFLYKGSSCALRHIFDRDDPIFAIPAGLISSVAFTQYPDVTVALYVMWKMLQIVYNLGIHKKVVPKVPGFTIFLYCFSTATLFHAAIVEPKALRTSYWKFLFSISGGRVSLFDRSFIDAWGLSSNEALAEVIKKTGTAVTVPIHPFSF